MIEKAYIAPPCTLGRVDKDTQMIDDTDLLYEVVSAIAHVEGRGPDELGYALHSYIDTEAVSSLAEMDHEQWQLEFEVPDHTVSIEGDGRIRVDGVVVRQATLP